MRVLLATSVLVLLASAGCGTPPVGPLGDGERMGGPMDDHMGRGDGPTVDDAAGPDARRIRVTMTNFGFSPSTIEVAAGEEVTLVVENDSAIFHDLVVDDLGLRIGVDPGETGRGALRADEPGDYRFYCSVPGHADAGMEGTLTVGSG